MLSTNDDYKKYLEIFHSNIIEIQDLLKGVFSYKLSEWGGGAILPAGAHDKDRFMEEPKHFAPFCFYVREQLGMKNICYACDDRMAKEASKIGKAIDYWCDWGMRDIAVPILLHGVNVGTIFCGQKILADPGDLEGQSKLLNFAERNGVEDKISDLIEKRFQSIPVSYEEIQKIKRFLWATSQYISQLVYSQLDNEPLEQRLDDHKKLNRFFNTLSEVSNSSSIWQFWSDFEGILPQLLSLLNAFGAVILIIESGKAKVVASHGLEFNSKEEINILEEQLISAEINNFDGAKHIIFGKDIESLCCPICRRVIQNHPTVNMILFAKSNLINLKEDKKDRTLHSIVFFDSTIERKNSFILHEKKSILFQTVLAIVNLFAHLEQVNNLKYIIRQREKFLKDVAHQFRQPLHSMLAYCDNLISQCFPEERKTRIPVYLRDMAKHASILTKCVEYASRGETNIFLSEKMNPANHNINKFLIDCAISMQGYSEEQGIHIHVEDTAAAIGEVEFDQNKLELALINILFNAVKYSFPETEITVSANHDKKDDSLVLTVTSLGIEIPRDKWRVIFDRGVRTALARDYSQSGLGLGLFISREIITAMGGKAYVVESTFTGNQNNCKEYKNKIALTLPGRVILGKKGR